MAGSHGPREAAAAGAGETRPPPPADEQEMVKQLYDFIQSHHAAPSSPSGRPGSASAGRPRSANRSMPGWVSSNSPPRNHSAGRSRLPPAPPNPVPRLPPPPPEGEAPLSASGRLEMQLTGLRQSLRQDMQEVVLEALHSQQEFILRQHEKLREPLEACTLRLERALGSLDQVTLLGDEALDGHPHPGAAKPQSPRPGGVEGPLPPGFVATECSSPLFERGAKGFGAGLDRHPLCIEEEEAELDPCGASIASSLPFTPHLTPIGGLTPIAADGRGPLSFKMSAELPGCSDPEQPLDETPRQVAAPHETSGASSDSTLPSNMWTTLSQADTRRTPQAANGHSASAPAGDGKASSRPEGKSKTQVSSASMLIGGSKRARLSLGRAINMRENDTLAARLSDLRDFTEYRLLQSILTFLIGWLDWWANLKEPPRRGCMAALVNSKGFDLVCMAVILLNGIFTAVGTEIEMQDLRPVPPLWMTITEAVFVGWYVIELLLKVFVHRLYFMCNEDMKWNLLDLNLVIISAGDVAIEVLTHYDKDNGHGKNAGGMNISFLRQFRFFKMAKILRMFRVLQFFTDLRLMLDCVLGSFFALFWCIVMIVFVQYVFGLFIMQGLTDFLLENEGSADQVAQIRRLFGSVPRTVLSLFQAVTGGIDWFELHDVVGAAGSLMSATFLFYIAFFVVAAWNVITSTYVQKALKIAQPDIDSLMLEKQKKDRADARELMSLFKEMDTDGSGSISLEEFMQVVNSTRFSSFLEVRGIDIKDAKLFYHMLRSLGSMEKGKQQESVDIGILTNGCLRMKGLATSIDLHTVLFESRHMMVQQQRCFEECIRRMEKVEKLVTSQGKLESKITTAPAG